MSVRHSIGRVIPLLALLAIPAALWAQPAGAPPPWEATVRYTRTADTELHTGGPAGSVGVDSYQLGLRSSVAIDGKTRFLFGLEWARHELSRHNQSLLPGTLKSLAAPLGVSRRLDERWSLLGTANLRLAGADGGLSSARFDLPLLVLANYTPSPTVTWSFGVRYGARSHPRVLPIAGFDWRPAPEWSVKVAWPESGVSYTISPNLTLRAVATIHGGDYRVAEDPRPGQSAWAGDWLEYREIRAGLAAEYSFSPALVVRLDLGRTVDQRFEYQRRGPTLEGDAATFWGIAVRSRF